MVRLPRLGPKLSPPPTDLDDDSMERLDAFTSMTDAAKLVSTRRLLWLAVVWSGPLRLRDEHTLKSTDEVVVLTPHTVVMTQQQMVGAEKVNYYVERIWGGEPLKPARITDAGRDAGWWHLDGLHRLLAARILGRDLEAKVWR